MRRGDWEAAWRISDRVAATRPGRVLCDPTPAGWLPRHGQGVWNGTSWSGKRVVVHCLHGLGDTIQFIRFVALLSCDAAQVTVLAQPQLIPLLKTVQGIDALAGLDDAPHEGAPVVAIEIMELPYALRAQLSTLPNTVPYIHVNEKRPRPEYNRGPRVGLVWQAGAWDATRSIPVELMRELTAAGGINFSILQRGPALDSWRYPGAEIPAIRDIRDEAVELQALDLLICVDTLSAHLAGALGVPTWTLLPSPADWRWMEDRDDTPWYPTMRLFRQSRPGHWHSVIARVRRDLQRRFN